MLTSYQALQFAKMAMQLVEDHPQEYEEWLKEFKRKEQENEQEQ